MEKTLVLLTIGVANDKAITSEIESTDLAKQRKQNKQEILSGLREIRKFGLEGIIAAEKTIVAAEFRDHANSKNMAASLSDALEELTAIETHIRLVGDPKAYGHINASCAQHKLRDTRDLPKDGARRSFRSHDTRLGNYDKAKSDDLEKEIIQTRQQNIRIAEKRYIERQEKALGREARKR